MDTDAVLERVIGLRRARQPAVMVTVVDTKGSTPRKAGTRMLYHPDGSIDGTIGGGAVEHVLRDVAQRVLYTGKGELVTHALTSDLAMCCGGQMTFFLEPVLPRPTLIIFGCGHVGAAIARAAQPIGFDRIVVDDLITNTAEFAETCFTLSSYEPSDLMGLPFGLDCYGVIVTRDHGIDQRLLEFCILQPWAYLGVIGSQRKAAMQRERLALRGIAPDHIARVHCPMGLDIGAETPEEIAISVCAELIAVRRHPARAAR